MNNIRQWIVYLCITIISVSVITVMVPEGGMKKILKIVSSLIIFCIVISPINSIGLLNMKLPDFLDFEGSFSENPDMQEGIDAQIMKISEERVIHTIRQTLENEKINFSDIGLSMDIDEDRSIFINELFIYTDDFEDVSEIEDVILKHFNLDCTVIVQGRIRKNEGETGDIN